MPLYDSLGENAIEYILEHSEASAVFVETGKMDKLAAALPDVKAQVRMEPAHKGEYTEGFSRADAVGHVVSGKTRARSHVQEPREYVALAL